MNVLKATQRNPPLEIIWKMVNLFGAALNVSFHRLLDFYKAALLQPRKLHWNDEQMGHTTSRPCANVVKINVVVPAVVTRMNVEVSLWHRLKTVSEAVPSKAFLGNRLVYCMCWPNLGCYGGTQRGIAPLPLPRDAGMFDLGFSSKARQENSTST